LATNVGHQVTLFVTGSFLIETIFDIDGFGLLGFNSVIDRDYPVVMGVLTLSASLMLIGQCTFRCSGCLGGPLECDLNKND
jgi:microcin C transport system permease protein